jgi:hypothetical protein
MYFSPKFCTTCHNFILEQKLVHLIFEKQSNYLNNRDESSNMMTALIIVVMLMTSDSGGGDDACFVINLQK